MKHLPVSALTILTLTLALTACGDRLDDDDEAATGTVSLGMSDAPVDDVKEVTVTVDRIILKPVGEDAVVIDTFTSEDLSLVDADTFQIDLLDYRGGAQAIVVEELELTAGEYSDLRLDILDENSQNSFVIDLEDQQKAIKVPSDELKLGGFDVDADTVQTFTIDMDLRRSLVYRPGPDDYILKPRGVQVVDNAGTVTLSGEVDSSLFNSVDPCDNKTEPATGNVLYLYEGHDLVVDNLADDFDPDLVDDVPEETVAPYATQTPLEQPDGSWEYAFGFLPAGDYTLVFSCDAGDDDPETLDGITLPLPEEQIQELSLGAGSGVVCNLPIENESCSN